jgi:uncharacterized YigZ family protein
LKTVTGSYSDLFRVKGSKFIGFLFPCSSAGQFDEVLKDVVSAHPTATHHCYARRIGLEPIKEFAQDDGEPPGTAGQPILNQLKSAGLVNSGLIVVRYYGGTNLGKGGLIDAYGHTADLCIAKAPLKTVRATKLYKVQYTYNQQNLIEKWKNDYQLIEKEAEYLEKVTLTLACPVESSSNFLNSLQNSSHLITFFEELGNGFELR